MQLGLPACTGPRISNCGHMQELAWASYALLRNTNSSGLLVARGGKTLAVRGAFGLPAAPSRNGADALGSIAEVGPCCCG